MKKSILLIAAMFAAFTVSAKEITVDLSKAAEMAYTACSGTPTYASNVLTVDYMTPGAWLWAGVEIPIDNISGITTIKYEMQGDGSENACIPYLRDSEGARWAYNAGDGAPTLEKTDWDSYSSSPDKLMWDAASYAYGEKPFVQVGFIANPGAAATGSFKLRNVVVVVPGGTSIDNTASEVKAIKTIKDGQMVIVRDGKSYNALGAEMK